MSLERSLLTPTRVDHERHAAVDLVISDRLRVLLVLIRDSPADSAIRVDIGVVRGFEVAPHEVKTSPVRSWAGQI